MNNKGNEPIDVFTGLNTKKFMMLISMVSMSMIFIALTSALLVKKGDTVKWENFKIPSMFFYSTLIVVCSSITIQWAHRFYVKGQDQYKTLLFVTLLLGMVFMLVQYLGWVQLKELGFAFSGNVSGSFVYVITGFHLAHIFGGMLALLITWIKHVRKLSPVEELKRIADNNKKVNLEVLIIFWHFLGALWIYLYAFLFLVYNL